MGTRETQGPLMLWSPFNPFVDLACHVGHDQWKFAAESAANTLSKLVIEDTSSGHSSGKASGRQPPEAIFSDYTLSCFASSYSVHVEWRKQQFLHHAWDVVT